MIGGLDYFSMGVFEREYHQIFSRRSFIQTADCLGSRNSYWSFLDFGHPVTLRRDGGAFRLLSNVCLHRSSLIDPLGSGDRPFSCGYHGWTYTNTGDLARAPLVDVGCLKRRKLESETLTDNFGLLFRDRTGTLADDAPLQELPLALADGFFHQSCLEHDANWKLLVENVLESYHISAVHGSSFVAMGITSASELRTGYLPGGSWFDILGARRSGLLVGGGDPVPRYRHLYVFPNLFVSLTDNTVGFIGWLVPVSPAKTILHWRLFEADGMRRLRASAKETVRRSSIEFTQKVLEEDRSVLQLAHIGASRAREPHQLQEAEGRIAHFHGIYSEFMEGA
jgi:phenylpropionate dioxygenase-like ring-hydroxylating dioxygenase large terminal subunit